MSKSKYGLLLFLSLFSLNSLAQEWTKDAAYFKKADSIAKSCDNISLDNLPYLSYRLTANLDEDVEKFRSIFIWVCSYVKNDYPLFLKNKRKRNRYKDDQVRLKKWNDDFKHILLKKLVKKNKTICSGYAYIIETLSELAGLECEFIEGYGRTSRSKIKEGDMPNHSWNAIKLENKWYLVDATWASNAKSPTLNSFDGYFLTDPSIFALNHYPTDKKWLLLDDKTMSLSEFKELPLFYSSSYNYLSSYESPAVLLSTIKPNKPIEFTFGLKAGINTKGISFLIDNGKSLVASFPEIIATSDDELLLQYTFKRNGHFDLHLLFDSNLIASYTFKVTTR